MNRFVGVKTLGQLYNVFDAEDVVDYSNLTADELETVANVFEANIPDKVSMPDRPLTEAGYTLIWNVTVETVEAFINKATETINNTNNNMEDNNMNKTVNNETAATVEEVTMGQKAKEFAEASKEKLAKGFEFVVENVDVAADEVKKMANMNDTQLENYLKNNGKDVLDKIVNAVKNFATKARKDGESFSFFSDVANDSAVKADNIVELIKDVLDEEELSGWGKFKAIVKELVRWLLRLLLKVGAIVLKIAFTIVVGAVKIGATTLVTAGKVINVVNKDVVQPSIKAGKKAWNNHKAYRDAKRAEKEAEADYVDEFRDAIFDVE